MLCSKKRKLSGQAALEYLSIVGIALLLLTPIILLAQQHVKELNNDTRMMLAIEAKNKIAAASDVVHAQGPPSAMTIGIQLPAGIVRAIVENQMILIEVPSAESSTDLVSMFDYNVTGNLSTSAGSHKIRIEAMYDVVNITVIP